MRILFKSNISSLSWIFENIYNLRPFHYLSARKRSRPKFCKYTHNRHSTLGPAVTSPRLVQESIINEVLGKGLELSEGEVKTLREKVLTSGTKITKTNFDALFLEFCRQHGLFKTGREYFYSIHLKGEANIGTMGKFCKLCYSFRDLCKEEDKDLIKLLYKELREKYPLLDGNSCENWACGLSVTDLWQEGLPLIEMASETSSATPLTYSALIESAFLNGVPQIAWSLMQKALAAGKKLQSTVFRTYFHVYPNDKEAFLKLLSYFEENNTLPSQEIAEIIKENHANVMKTSIPATFTEISPRGYCKNCGKVLRPIKVKPDEFKELCDAFLEPVLVGKDIYLKTRPGELQSYLGFIRRTGKVDVVLDGLNVAYSAGIKKSPFVYSKMLRDVVHHFVKDSKRVMVLGRKHMVNWPKENMNYVMKNAVVFLAEDMSADDPLVLYGAMQSGLGTKFVSRDMMRGHKFLLKDSRLSHIFAKWQQKHQAILKNVLPNGKVLFQESCSYLIGAQREDGVYHLAVEGPSVADIPPYLAYLHTRWLCAPLD